MCTMQNGDMAVWKCLAFGKTEKGKDKSIAVIQMMTGSPKLAWLNKLLVVYESIGDMKTMEFAGTGYEWK